MNASRNSLKIHSNQTKIENILLFSEHKTCTSEEFACKNNEGECIPLAWMCDQNNDCTDGSDEAACSKLNLHVLSLLLFEKKIKHFLYHSFHHHHHHGNKKEGKSFLFFYNTHIYGNISFWVLSSLFYCMLWLKYILYNNWNKN